MLVDLIVARGAHDGVRLCSLLSNVPKIRRCKCVNGNGNLAWPGTRYPAGMVLTW